MTDTIAIDFGTSRTKLAYLKDGKPELMRFGHDRVYAPSLFYLPAGDGPIRWGNDAEEMLARDPAGVVVTLKRQLGERSVRGAGGRKETPGRLLTLMLSDLRRWAGERLPAFGGQPPSRVCLTLPSLYRPVEERALRDAAAEAGFAADAVELLPEPVAAARAWLAETGKAADEVVVFDAGGGTIDWAYLRRENNAFRIVPECVPDGDRQVGGHDVDELLLELLEEVAGAAGDEIPARRSHFLQEVRHLKEQFCRDLPLHPVWVGGREITLPAKAIADAIEERFISQACDALCRYLDKVRTVAGAKGLPPVLLVGGSSALKGLAPTLEQRLGCKTAQWERSEYATVLGFAEGNLAIADRVILTISPGPAVLDDRRSEILIRALEPFSGEGWVQVGEKVSKSIRSDFKNLFPEHSTEALIGYVATAAFGQAKIYITDRAMYYRYLDSRWHMQNGCITFDHLAANKVSMSLLRGYIKIGNVMIVCASVRASRVQAIIRSIRLALN